MDETTRDFVQSMIARSGIAAANVLLLSKAYELLGAELQRRMDANELTDEFIDNAFNSIRQFAVALTERSEAELSQDTLKQGWGNDVAAMHAAVHRLHNEGAVFNIELIEAAFREVKGSD